MVEVEEGVEVEGELADLETKIGNKDMHSIEQGPICSARRNRMVRAGKKEKLNRRRKVDLM